MKETQLNIVKRNKGEVLELLQKNEKRWQAFCSFPLKYQEELLQFCTGEQGLRITYDAVFKKIFSPEKHRDRLEDFISSILGKKVKIVRILQHEGTQLQEKGSFIIMDVVVQLEDGSLINIEMQKLGYRFTAERTDCYLADLLMRQYNDVKEIKGKRFSFKDMSKVMSIVIMEQSPKQFHMDNNHYIHKGKMQYDSGIVLDDLFEIIYICLDTYKSFLHTDSNSKKEAWLRFLSSTDLEDILYVCEQNPQFITLYQEVFDFGKDVNELVRTFTDELREMDRNEERYMVEELQDELRVQREKLQEEIKEQREKLQEELRVQKEKYEESQQEIEKLRAEIKRLKRGG